MVKEWFRWLWWSKEGYSENPSWMYLNAHLEKGGRTLHERHSGDLTYRNNDKKNWKSQQFKIPVGTTKAKKFKL